MQVNRQKVLRSETLLEQFKVRVRTFERRLLSEVSGEGLAIVRVLFGALMCVDTFNERGFLVIEERWSLNFARCRFPLFGVIGVPPSLPVMYAVYMVMFAGAFGIMIGFFFKLSCAIYLIAFVYLLLLEKSFWNNHSYLFALIAFILLAFSKAAATWSIDDRLQWQQRRRTVQYLEYFLLRFQVSLVYFYAGLKKFNREWIGGHSMYFLSDHWSLTPFKLILTAEQIDLWLIHWGGFLIDSSVGILLYFERTRSLAYLICFVFNSLNSRMFNIGMFPYVMIVLMSVHSAPDWPSKLLERIKNFSTTASAMARKFDNRKSTTNFDLHCSKWKIRAVFVYITVQLFLPYSHFLTPGYKGWTDGLYGYSWDMMVHNWRVLHRRVTVTGVDRFGHRHRLHVNADRLTLNARWTHHPDMAKQMARCVARQVSKSTELNQLSVYFDIWISLNGRCTQRIFDPRTDILTAEWSAFRRPNWTVPLLDEFLAYRPVIKNNESFTDKSPKRYIFFAEFPGQRIINYINDQQREVKVQLLNGQINIEQSTDAEPVSLKPGELFELKPAHFHRITVAGNSTPASFVYIFGNQ